MPMMDPSSDPTTIYLAHGAFFLVAMAFLVRDVLWLRVLAILANGLLIVIALTKGEGSLRPEQYWYVLLIAINAVHAVVLVYERRLMRLTPEEQRLYEAAFAAFDRVAVKKLLRLGSWRVVQAGEILAREGERPEQLVLLSEGSAEVRLGDQRIAELGPGRFVCEISFITQRPANATVSAQGPLRCLTWDRVRLERRLAKDPQLGAVMSAAIGSNLATKIAVQNAGAAAAAAVRTEWANDTAAGNGQAAGAGIQS